MADVSSLKVNSTVYTIKDGVARANLDDKLNKNVGVEYAGKILKVDANGFIVPSTSTAGVDFRDIGGLPTDNTNLAAALAAKTDKTGTLDVAIGRDSEGAYIEY